MNLDQYILELRTRAAMIEELQGQIGKQVMVRNTLDDQWKGPCKLRQVHSAIWSFEVLHSGYVVTIHKFAKLATALRKRVLIRDRIQLARVLLDQGYLPTADGAFVNLHKDLNRFPSFMWNYVGCEVEPVENTPLWKFVKEGNTYLMRGEWTEEVEAVE